jgi:hypothetical protein
VPLVVERSSNSFNVSSLTGWPFEVMIARSIMLRSSRALP